MFIKLFSKRENKYNYSVDELLYERVLDDLKGSKYCGVSEEEEKFIHELLLRLSINKETKDIRLYRMSNKAISVNYNMYPLGKIRLQGRKTWMQILIDLYDHETINGTLHDYLNGIDRWILYIKNHLNAT